MVLLGTTVHGIRLVEELGKGGMGEVYVGVDETLGRRVAVKAVHADRRMDAHAKTRFLREARILSQLEHPNICRIYQFIETDEADLIVLELVAGRTLREAMRDVLSAQQQLDIAEQVARALAAAHSVGVVHRDLKPENIMVAEDGSIKVLDFGLARTAAANSPAEHDRRQVLSFEAPVRASAEVGATLTGLGTIKGTPRYMSPEQARSEPLTAASDLYSFGLVVYELVSGRSPVPAETPVSATLLRRAMGTETLSFDGVDRELASLIKELTAPSPAGRPSAITALDRLRWVRERPRRRLRKVALAAVATSLAVGTGLATLGLVHARRSLAEAEAARDQAEAVNTFLQGILASAAPDAKGKDVKVVDVLGEAALRVDRDFADHPLDRAAVLLTLGNTYRALGDAATAERLLAQAVEIRERELGADHPDTTQALDLLGLVVKERGRYEESEEMHRRALEARRRTLGEESWEAVGSLSNLANVLARQSRFDEAEPMLRKVLELRRRGLGPEHPDTLKATNDLAVLLWSRGSFAEAAELYRQLLDVGRRVLGDDHPQVISASGNLAVVLAELGHNEEAEAAFRTALDLERRVLGEDHPTTLGVQANLANLLRRMDRPAVAEPLERQVLEARRRRLGNEHPSVVSAMHNLALTLTALGRYDEAEALYHEALELARRVLKPEDRAIHTTGTGLVSLYLKQHRYVEAEAVARGVVDGLRRTLGREHPTTLSAVRALALSVAPQGRVDEVESLFREVFEARLRVLGAEHPRTRESRGELVSALRQLGRDEEADALERPPAAAIGGS